MSLIWNKAMWGWFPVHSPWFQGSFTTWGPPPLLERWYSPAAMARVFINQGLFKQQWGYSSSAKGGGGSFKDRKLINYRRRESLWCMDGRTNPLMDRKVVEARSLSFFLSFFLSLSLSLSPSLCVSFSLCLYLSVSLSLSLSGSASFHGLISPAVRRCCCSSSLLPSSKHAP